MIIQILNNGTDGNKSNLRSKFILELDISLIKYHLEKLPMDLSNRIAKYFDDSPKNFTESQKVKCNEKVLELP